MSNGCRRWKRALTAPAALPIVSILASGALQGQEAVDFDRDRAYQVDSTVYAPFRPLNHGTASGMVARVAKRAGVDLPRAGSHVLRHSTATGLLAGGMSLPAIGVLLRHASLDTTAIYAKVHVDLLGEIARPWPMEVSP